MSALSAWLDVTKIPSTDRLECEDTRARDCPSALRGKATFRWLDSQYSPKKKLIHSLPTYLSSAHSPSSATDPNIGNASESAQPSTSSSSPSSSSSSSVRICPATSAAFLRLAMVDAGVCTSAYILHLGSARLRRRGKDIDPWQTHFERFERANDNWSQGLEAQGQVCGYQCPLRHVLVRFYGFDRSQRTVREVEIEVQGGSGQASWRRRSVVVVARGTGEQVGTFTASRPAASRSPIDA